MHIYTSHLKKLIVLLCVIIGYNITYAQPLKRELRAAWIATVANIDWPSSKTLSSTEQKEQFILRLDKLKNIGCNTVIVQVRPSCDACYPSSKEPWCQYLTGTQGSPPIPYYDPLEFMIEETHKRNMEFHAWFNPFRALVNCKANPNPSNHVTKKHKDWIINYGDKAYLDPGIPEVRDYVNDVIMDVVKRYDIDAIHLDDYFYPYRIGKINFGDKKSYLKYGKGIDKDTWRRENVNKFIKELSVDMKKEKPYLKFGISPFGVWRNKSKDTLQGSETRAGQTCYDDLYADVITWLKNGWIDYLMPQLYWSHKNKAASFTVLLPWWQSHCYNRQIFYGLGAYQVSNSKSDFDLNELLQQIKDIRKNTKNTGFSFYSAISLDKLGKPIKDSLNNSYTKYPAFPPVMNWIDSIPPNAPVLKLTENKKENNLHWEEYNPKNEPIKYAVYRFLQNEEVNIERTDRIISLQQSTTYIDNDIKSCKHCTYIVTALDRLWNESKPSNKVQQ